MLDLILFFKLNSLSLEANLTHPTRQCYGAFKCIERIIVEQCNLKLPFTIIFQGEPINRRENISLLCQLLPLNYDFYPYPIIPDEPVLEHLLQEHLFLLSIIVELFTLLVWNNVFDLFPENLAAVPQHQTGLLLLSLFKTILNRDCVSNLQRWRKLPAHYLHGIWR